MRLACVLAALTALLSCGDGSPTKPTPVCSYSLGAQSQSFTSDGGSGSVAITTDPQCAWSVQAVPDWVTVASPASGTGPGTVSYAVAANADTSAREQTLMVATRPYRISQEARASCSASISPEQQAFGDEGGHGEVQVTTSAPGCTWSAATTVAWLAITAGASGQGAGVVKFTAGPNNEPDARTGTLTIASRTFTVTQDGEGNVQPAGCTYAVSPAEFTPCMPGGRITASVTTQPRCQWTVTPGVSWLSVPSGASASGAGSITIAFTDNYDAPRDGLIMVRWPTPTAGQNIRIEQAGCTYGVSQASFSMAAAGGSASFSVVQESQPNSCGGAMQDQCRWTAQSNVSWITITTGMPRMGDNPVAFTVAANTGAARTGRITVRDQTVTISQAAP